MTKFRPLLLVSAASFFLYACGGASESAQTETEETATETTAIETTKYSIDPTNTKVTWKGTMLGMYEHFGTIDLISGSLEMADGKVVGGNFVIDMTTMKPTDENYGEDNTPDKLVGHLSSSEFFDVANSPTSTLVITDSDGQYITGDLTVRNETSPVEITEFNVQEKDGEVFGKAGMIFDRTKYGVSWVHPIKENVLSDDIQVSVQFNGSPE